MPMTRLAKRGGRERRRSNGSCPSSESSGVRDGGEGGGASAADARRYAKEKQEAEQRERQQLRIVGQRRGAARVGDAGQGGHQVQGVIGGVEALTGCRCGGEREAEKSGWQQERGRSQAAGAGESGRRKRVRREKRMAAGERALTGCRCGGEREANRRHTDQGDPGGAWRQEEGEVR